MSRASSGRLATMTVMVLVVLLSGCSPARPVARAHSAAVPVASTVAAPDWRAQANMLASAVGELAFSADFSNEPRGDIVPASKGFDRFFAQISDVTTGPATVTFDVEQFLYDDAATKAAAQDGKSPFENGSYIRNRYPHKQTLRLSADVPVILQVAGGRLEGDPAFGSEGMNPLTPVSFGEFARRFKSDRDKYGSSARYVLSYNSQADGTISSIVQVYFP